MEQPKNSQNLQPKVDKIDTTVNVGKEQQYSEASGDDKVSPPKKSYVPESNAQKIRLIQDYLNANPNISSEGRKQCETQIIKLRGGSSSGASVSGRVSIDTEDVEALLRQLRQFQDTIGGDWKTVVNQWQNLRDCWRDRQYDQFEPFFEELCQTYNQCESECRKHISFLMLAKLRAKLS